MSERRIDAVSTPDERGDWTTEYDGEDYESIAHVLAEETGRPVETFQCSDSVDIPPWSGLKTVEVDNE